MIQHLTVINFIICLFVLSEERTRCCCCEFPSDLDHGPGAINFDDETRLPAAAAGVTGLVTSRGTVLIQPGQVGAVSWEEPLYKVLYLGIGLRNWLPYQLRLIDNG